MKNKTLFFRLFPTGQQIYVKDFGLEEKNK